MAPLAPFRWDNLLDDVKIRVASFLPCRERARVSKSSRSVRLACRAATTCHPHVTNAIMPENIGRPFCEILNILRYGVYQLGLGGQLSARAKHILDQGPNVGQLLNLGMHEDVASLNSRVFSYWETDFSGSPDTGLLNYLTLIKECNPHLKLEMETHLPQVLHWPQSRVNGPIYVLLERPDGTVVVAADTMKVYLTQGILSSVGKLLLRGGGRLPIRAVATFLPFHGYVAFDGLVAGVPTPVSAELRRKLYQTYCRAVDDGTLITTLPLQPLPTRTPGPGKSPISMPTAVEVPQLSPAQQSQLQRVQRLSKPTNPYQGTSWVFRRYGYTEQENPDHLITIMSFKGRPILPGFVPLKSLQPTALELFDLLCIALFGDGTGSARECPGVILTDERTALAPLQALLKPSGIVVQYYPPPAPEEEFCSRFFGGCANCHIPNETLKAQGRPPLSQCQRCKQAQYCSRECQKAHWKLHKQNCNPAPK